MYGMLIYAFVPYATAGGGGSEPPEPDLPPTWQEICKPADEWVRVDRVITLNTGCKDGTGNG